MPLVLAFGCLGRFNAAAADPVYLSTVGPAPFRFQPLPRPVTARPIVTPPATAPQTTAKANPSAISTNAPPPPAISNSVSPTAALAPTNEIDLPASLPSDEVVSPQMLLKYFNRSTNGTGTGIIAPLQLPGQPPPLPSKATYSN